MRERIEIPNTRLNNVFSISVLIVFIIISFGLPIFVLVFGGSEIRFGFIITIITFGGVGIYLLRLLLWNVFGKEVYTIEDNTLEFYNDYKYFKDNRITISLVNCRFSKIMLEDLNKGYFIIEYEGDILKSSILLDENKLDDIICNFKEIVMNL